MLSLAIGFVLGVVVGFVLAARQAAKGNVQVSDKLKGLMLPAYRAHDAAHEAWRRAVHDKWLSAFTDYGCGPGPECDRYIAEAEQRAEQSVAAAERAHLAARAVLGQLDRV